MARVSCQATIQVPADVIWQVIGDFGAAAQYLTGVVTCTVEGAGVGARRTLTSADGTTIVERLESLDAVAHPLSYVLLTDTPFRDCLTTMSLCDLGRNQAELVWSAAFQPKGLPVSEAVALLEGALAADCQAMKQFMEAGT